MTKKDKKIWKNILMCKKPIKELTKQEINMKKIIIQWKKRGKKLTL